MNLKIIRTNSANKDFINLVKKLDAYLKITDGDEHDFYNQFNTITVLKNVVVIYADKTPIGCGAMKHFDDKTVEIKRMFVDQSYRNLGIAKLALQELENWAKEIGCDTCVLETGKRQIEAVHFYHKCNYKIIPNYGQYIAMENSICFKKNI
ncbi:GNAT family N-acetyltransferase [Polaribacter sp. WD7]|uniref:GNAT family N-acetyltransferase n=1 Tax=Polaribacter sp. WD7 TaxID=2269061 RepID=UPI000DF3D522|nr:GNAT family N-acetyltransferase [Polaribacter sp. WD7]RCS26043.1 GNAT family N-acetyltransferase [Polaribacter sp. WD7]